MLSRAPFVGIASCYISGILTADWLLSWLSVSSEVFQGTLLVALLICFLFYFVGQKVSFGVGFAMFLICLGVFTRMSVEERRNSDIELLTGKDYSCYEAIVTSLPEKRKSSVRMEVMVNRILLNNKQWLDTRLKALINVDSETAQIPKPGETIVAKSKLDLPIAATNPGQFDYRRFLRNKGFLWTDYLREEHFHVISQVNPSMNVALASIKISDWADQVFRAHIKNDQSYGLVKAMLLGRRDDLGEEQVDHYVASGTVHILSVSGMHVAIIFLIISYLLGWMKRFKHGAAIYLFAVILLLAFYALVTGLAPSVQRATVMCIVFVIAECFGRKNNAMNTLAISALLILLFDPSALYDVGFQLSYAAMTGIFLFYEPILTIYSPDNRVLKFVWQVTALSFAAQLATFPLSLYYFHQFPTYFWLINPFVIAFTNVLLPAAMAILVVSKLNAGWLHELVGLVVDWSARLTDLSVTIPEKMPGYLIENLHLGKLEMLLLYTLLLAIWYAYHAREYLYLKCAFAVTLLFASIAITQSIYIYITPAIAVHSVPKHSVRSFKYGNVLYVVSDHEFVSDTNAYDFYLKNYAIGVETEETTFITSQVD